MEIISHCLKYSNDMETVEGVLDSAHLIMFEQNAICATMAIRLRSFYDAQYLSLANGGALLFLNDGGELPEYSNLVWSRGCHMKDGTERLGYFSNYALMAYGDNVRGELEAALKHSISLENCGVSLRGNDLIEITDFTGNPKRLLTWHDNLIGIAYPYGFHISENAKPIKVDDGTAVSYERNVNSIGYSAREFAFFGGYVVGSSDKYALQTANLQIETGLYKQPGVVVSGSLNYYNELDKNYPRFKVLSQDDNIANLTPAAAVGELFSYQGQIYLGIKNTASHTVLNDFIGSCLMNVFENRPEMAYAYWQSALWLASLHKTEPGNLPEMQMETRGVQPLEL